MMSAPWLIAAGFAFASAVQPGPLQAFLLSATTAHGWKRTLPAAFSPLVSDGPIAATMLLLLHQVPPGFERVLRMAGGLLLIYLAVGAFRDWRRQRTRDPGQEASAPRTLLKAAAVNILNPNPYLGWSLVLGPLVLQAWSVSAMGAVSIVAAFYITMVVMLTLTIVVFGTLRSLGPRIVGWLLLASAVMLLVLGVYQISTAAWLP